MATSASNKSVTFSSPCFFCSVLAQSKGHLYLLFLAVVVETAIWTPWTFSSAFVPAQVCTFLWLGTLSPGILWSLLGQAKVSPGGLSKAVFQVILSSKCLGNTGQCIFPDLCFSTDKLKFPQEETWVTSSEIHPWYLHGTSNKVLVC